MPKTKEDTSTSIFEETIKAVNIAKRLEEEAARELSDKERLNLLNNLKSKVRTAAEEEEMEKEELRLKRRLRFPEKEAIKIPEEHIETVKKNYEVEKAEADKALQAKYQRAAQLNEYLLELNETLGDLIEMEDQKAHAYLIEEVLLGRVIKNPGQTDGLPLRLQFTTRYSKGHGLKVIKKNVAGLIDKVSRIEN